MVQENLHDCRCEFFEFVFPRTRLAVEPVVVGRATQVEDFADDSRGDGGVASDRFESRVEITHSLRPKMANAFFNGYEHFRVSLQLFRLRTTSKALPMQEPGLGRGGIHCDGGGRADPTRGRSQHLMGFEPAFLTDHPTGPPG
jgi:hypothetical protein